MAIRGPYQDSEKDAKLSKTTRRKRHFDDLFLFNATEDLTYLHAVLLASLKYPRLSLSTVIHRNVDEELRLQYLVPGLRVLKLYEHGRDHEDHMWDDYATFEYVLDDFLLQIQVRRYSPVNMLKSTTKSRDRQARNAARTLKASMLRDHRITVKPTLS